MTTMMEEESQLLQQVPKRQQRVTLPIPGGRVSLGNIERLQNARRERNRKKEKKNPETQRKKLRERLRMT